MPQGLHFKRVCDGLAGLGLCAPHKYGFPRPRFYDGRVFVADRENNRIQIFDAEGKYLEEWGGLARPCDIYIDQDNIIYVPELDGFMSILSIDGDIISTWDSPLDAGMGNGAHAVWVDSHGDLYVNQNVEGHRLVKYIRQ